MHSNKAEVANEITAIALERLAYGLSVLPNRHVYTALDEQKPFDYPNWKRFQTKRLDEPAARQAFLNAKGIAVLCGAISGNLLMIDFDKPGFFRDWIAIVPTELSARLLIETTLKHELDEDSGYHVYFRCESEVPGNQKLAQDVSGVAIETRGEGGLSYCHPQPGYEVIQGDWLGLPTLTASEMELLLQSARALTHVEPAPKPESKTRSSTETDTRPGTRWMKELSAGEFERMLEHDGAKCVRQLSGRSLWARPGKSSGVSATLFDSGVLHVFSSNWTHLDPDTSYNAWTYLVQTKHGGNYSAAAKAVAKELPAPALKVVTTEDGEVIEFARTDLGNAERLIHYADGNLRYCAVWQKWLAWDGKRWGVDESGGATVQQYASALVKMVAVEDREYGLKCQSSGKIRAMIDLAKGLPGVPVHPDELDGNDGEINLQNGIYDFRSGVLLGHDRTRLHTKIAEGSFDENAEAPRWEKFLEEITLDRRDLGDFLLRFLGYSLTGWTHEQKFLLCTGDGANGKSTLLETVRWIFGPYVADMPADMILSTQTDRPLYELESYKGCRLAYTQEPNKRRSLDRERIKKLVAGDLQRVAAKYGHPYDMKPKLKLWLLSNGKPNVEFDLAFRRRTLVMPFEFRPQPAELDLRLVDKLLAERDGVLSCILNAGHEYCDDGLFMPLSVADAIEEYEEENDVLGAWLSEECELEADGYTHPSDLFKSFEQYCERGHLRSGTIRTFKDAMRLRGYKTEPCGHEKLFCFRGIVLRQGEDRRPYWNKD